MNHINIQCITRICIKNILYECMHQINVSKADELQEYASQEYTSQEYASNICITSIWIMYVRVWSQEYSLQ